ncbi:MAG: hypothetical protein OI717_00710 (plasmid) [Candidatus Methanoperedens sp.]|nr:MAG: hypothetical protein OI717_00710 [Candidatus Methanoperedens sp.]
MTTKTLDDVMRRILNDSDIFYISYIIFDDAEWKELGRKNQESNPNDMLSKIDQKIKNLKSERNFQRNDIRKQAIVLAESLKSAINNKPYLLGQLFSTFDKFGSVRCNLPNMEDYGKVIENHNRSTVEQFFLYKIDKAKAYQKRALRKTLEYLKELYAMNLDTLEIAFFIRKLNSLTQFMEVLNDE